MDTILNFIYEYRYWCLGAAIFLWAYVAFLLWSHIPHSPNEKAPRRPMSGIKAVLWPVFMIGIGAGLLYLSVAIPVAAIQGRVTARRNYGRFIDERAREGEPLT